MGGLRSATVTCPCCGYRTLAERAAYGICIICWWEDDGQDDLDANKIRGGPNGEESLASARVNFRDHLTMYPREGDARIGGADTPVEIEAKRALMAALDRLRTAHADDAAALWNEVDHAEALLEAESDRKTQDDARRTALCCMCEGPVDAVTGHAITPRRTPGGTIIHTDDRKRLWLCADCWHHPDAKVLFSQFGVKFPDA